SVGGDRYRECKALTQLYIGRGRIGGGVNHRDLEAAIATRAIRDDVDTFPIRSNGHLARDPRYCCHHRDELAALCSRFRSGPCGRRPAGSGNPALTRPMIGRADCCAPAAAGPASAAPLQRDEFASFHCPAPPVPPNARSSTPRYSALRDLERVRCRLGVTLGHLRSWLNVRFARKGTCLPFGVCITRDGPSRRIHPAANSQANRLRANPTSHFQRATARRALVPY